MLVVFCMVVQLTIATHISTLHTMVTQATSTLLKFSVQYFIILSNLVTPVYRLIRLEFVYATKVITLTAAKRTRNFQGVFTLEKHLTYQQ